MFLFQHANNLGVPIEVEVEHHLVNRFTDSFMADGALFPLIRWCVPGNSQEKWAETGNRLKKYGFEKGINGNIGRHYAKLEANRPKQVGEWNESRMRIKEKKFTDQEAIENDKISIDKHNNSPHPDFEGMTRLQVLLSNPHPDMPPLDEIKLAFYFGKTRQATIYRTQYIKAHNTKYFLPNANIIEKLSAFKSGKSQLYSYTSPFNTGVVEKVYLFQGDNFICECVTEETYNRSRAEWSEADHEAYNKQKEYVTATREYIKEGVNSISKVQIIENIPDPEPETIEVIETTSETEIETNTDFDNDFYYDGKGRDEF